MWLKNQATTCLFGKDFEVEFDMLQPDRMVFALV